MTGPLNRNLARFERGGQESLWQEIKAALRSSGEGCAALVQWVGKTVEGKFQERGKRVRQKDDCANR